MRNVHVTQLKFKIPEQRAIKTRLSFQLFPVAPQAFLRAEIQNEFSPRQSS